MSIDTTPDHRRWFDLPQGVRFRGRDYPPEPLFGPPNVNYPGSDGRPMADNTLQYDWMTLIKGGLDTVFRDDPDVFVAGNLMWYPVEGNNRRRLAPDAMVAFGRPKGYRTSYVQHEEDGVPPHVVFEILSPGNRRRVIEYKRLFYERYGVEEYYHFDPYKIKLDVWIRQGDVFQPIAETSGWVSPRLGIRFELAENLTIFDPMGRPFEDVAEISFQRRQSEQRAEEEHRRAEEERRRAEEATLRAEEEHRRAEEATLKAEEATLKAEAERRKAEEATLRTERMAAKLRELGIDPDQ